MKKYIGYLLLIFIIFSTTTINASALDGQNLTSNKVIEEYNKTSKELSAYGYNKYSNLGTNNNTNVTQENKIKLNSLIANKEIIDYAFLDTTTYLLTSDGALYASGYNFGLGITLNKQFKQIHLYNSTKNKPSSINVKYNSAGNNISNIDKNVKGNFILEVMTSNKKVYYIFDNIQKQKPCVEPYKWQQDFYESEYDERTRSTYFIYTNNINSKMYEEVLTDGNKNINQKLLVYNNDYGNTSYIYQKNKLKSKTVYKKYDVTIYNYTNNSIKNKRIVKYKQKQNIIYGRFPVKEITYNYKDNKVNLKVVYKTVNYNNIITSKQKYVTNKAGQLKSNKNGKAKTYITYYKNKKAYVTYRYQYNSKGKMINKTKVKLIKNLK